MALVLAFDSGPLGQLAHPDNTRYPDLLRWLAEHRVAGTRFVFPEIADFEVRRNLILERRRRSPQISCLHLRKPQPIEHIKPMRIGKKCFLIHDGRPAPVTLRCRMNTAHDLEIRPDRSCERL